MLDFIRKCDFLRLVISGSRKSHLYHYTKADSHSTSGNFLPLTLYKKCDFLRLVLSGQRKSHFSKKPGHRKDIPQIAHSFFF